MRDYRQFVCWRREDRHGKPTKVPYDPRTGFRASVTDGSTWATFDEACAASGQYDGIGFVFTADDPFFGIDLDASDDPAICARQTAICEHFDTYSERSPSGTGLHIIGRGTVPTGRRRDKVELYPSGRFFTMTGDVVNDADIRDYGEAALQLWHEMAPASEPVADASACYRAATESDEAIYARAAAGTNGDKFLRLWNGDGSAVPGDDKSGSAIDMALVNILAFYTQAPDQIERLWRNCPHGLSRVEKLSRAAYVKGTIDKAFDRALPATFDPIRNFVAANDPRQPAPVGMSFGTWPAPTPITSDEWRGASSSPRAIVAHLLFADVGLVVAAGGTGKTTLVGWLAAHIVLGVEFCGRSIVAPGRVVILTAEDNRELLVARLRKVVSEMYPHGGMDWNEREAVMSAIRDRIIIIDVSASVVRLTRIERDVVRVDTAAVDALAGLLGPLSPSLLVIDPAVSFGVGEARVNDAEQGLIEAARRLRAAIGCGVLFVHHTGKANAREKTEDQYSGRGGSALADGSRMVFVLNRLEPKDWQAQTGRALEPGETGLKISVAKLSYCEPQAPLYVARKGYKFTHVAPAAQTDDEREADEESTVLSFVMSEIDKGVFHSLKSLTDARASIGLSRDKLRTVVHRLFEKGQLVEHYQPGKSNSLIPATLAGSFRGGA